MAKNPNLEESGPGIESRLIQGFPVTKLGHHCRTSLSTRRLDRRWRLMCRGNAFVSNREYNFWKRLVDGT
jgi:hypothetical protein